VKLGRPFLSKSAMVDENPSGMCLCGCGKPTKIIKAYKTVVKHYKFRRGHWSVRNDPQYKVVKNGCWNWLHAKFPDGYGRVLVEIEGAARKAPKLAHRVYYERAFGAIPPGLIIDHLCRNKSCVNPKHLEPVTYRANKLRGISCGPNKEKEKAVKKWRAILLAG